MLRLGLRSNASRPGRRRAWMAGTIDTSVMQRQDSDAEPYWFSSHERAPHPEQRPCWLTWAGEPVKELIRRHLADSALYGGAIAGRGPRYCPSVEDKVVKFPDAPRHQVFLEPEGLDTDELYVGGLSTSLPPEVQERMLRLVPGMEQVVMTRPGYAIEYDYLPPTQLDRTLAVKAIPGLYTAGQINGTTGYEEAAGQGVIAGLNAAGFALGLDPVVMGRDEGYCGVLVDDLVSCGVDEPYRLFTSRAEHRLMLRQDNALRRMLPIAMGHNLWSDAERAAAEGRLEREEAVGRLAADTGGVPGAGQRDPRGEWEQRDRGAGADRGAGEAPWGVAGGAAAGGRCGVRGGRRRMGVDRAAVWRVPGPGAGGRREVAAVGGDAVAGGHAVGGDGGAFLRGREKLARVQPSTLAQAGRIPGVSPADLQHLLIEVLRRERVR